MGAASEAICSVSGILKVFEILLGFITVIIHRYGDYGKMIFFGTPAVQLSPVSCNEIRHEGIAISVRPILLHRMILVRMLRILEMEFWWLI